MWIRDNSRIPYVFSNTLIIILCKQIQFRSNFKTIILLRICGFLIAIFFNTAIVSVVTDKFTYFLFGQINFNKFGTLFQISLNEKIKTL